MFKYDSELKQAIKRFWKTRSGQLKDQKHRHVSDQGNRGAATGGQQLNGFADLLSKISIDAGIPEECIFTKNSVLPGFFRATKKWDFLIISPKKNLVACIELKSQVGSFGNNFNNRSEEAIGSAVDIWTAYREGSFPCQPAPWLGFLFVVEKCNASDSEVKIDEPHFKTRAEFKKSSYLKRYEILCQKLIRERLYTSTTLIWTKKSSRNAEYGYPTNALSFESFVSSFSSYLHGRKREFED